MQRSRALLALVIGVAAVGATRPAHIASAPSAPLTFDASKIRVGHDSFDIFVGPPGQLMRAGSEVLDIKKDGARFMFVETISAPMIGLQGTLNIAFGSGLEPLQRVSHGSFQGASMTDSVWAQNNKIAGSMQTPTGPGTMKTVTVDGAVSGLTLLDNDLLIALLPTAELATGLTKTVSVLDPSSGKVVPMDVAVEGSETVTVPAGQFDVFRVRAKSADVLVAYVTTASPHRVVRVEYPGNGVELRLNK